MMRDKVNVFTKTAILLVRKSMYITSKTVTIITSMEELTQVLSNFTRKSTLFLTIRSKFA